MRCDSPAHGDTHHWTSTTPADATRTLARLIPGITLVVQPGAVPGGYRVVNRTVELEDKYVNT
jgi:hypothetical protein